MVKVDERNAETEGVEPEPEREPGLEPLPPPALELWSSSEDEGCKSSDKEESADGFEGAEKLSLLLLLPLFAPLLRPLLEFAGAPMLPLLLPLMLLPNA